MAETKVILCDICKKKVAESKCMICGADICGGHDCKRDIIVVIEGDSKAIWRIGYCEKHGNILRRRVSEEFFNPEIRDKIIAEINSYFLKRLVGEGLKKEKELKK